MRASSARSTAFRSIYSEKSTAYPATHPLPLRSGAVGRRDDHRPHDPPHRSRAPSRRRFRRRLRRAGAQRACPRRSTTMSSCWPASPPARAARLASDRYSPEIGDGTDIYGTEGTIHIATRDGVTLPCRAARRLHREVGCRPARRPARGALPDAWWKAFEGGWITVKPPRRNPYGKQLGAFCDSIREGTPARSRASTGCGRRSSSRPPICRCARAAGSTCPLAADAPFILPTYR